MTELDGWLCLDKPAGLSSNSAMIKVRSIIKQRVGYIGTLDPFATGVLPIAIGRARHFIQFAEDGAKTYVFTVVFGKTTDTLDSYGSITQTTEEIPTISQIKDVLPEFLGEIEQFPPVFSAIKIQGRRALRSGS